MDSMSKALDAVGTLAALVETLRKSPDDTAGDGMMMISREEYEELLCNQSEYPDDAVVPKSPPSLCIKLNSEQVGENCPVCGEHFIFHPGPQLYIDGTNDIVCEPCVCHYDDDMGDPTPLQVASKDMYEFFYFASANWKRAMDKRSKT